MPLLREKRPLPLQFHTASAAFLQKVLFQSNVLNCIKTFHSLVKKLISNPPLLTVQLRTLRAWVSLKSGTFSPHLIFKMVWDGCILHHFVRKTEVKSFIQSSPKRVSGETTDWLQCQKPCHLWAKELSGFENSWSKEEKLETNKSQKLHQRPLGRESDKKEKGLFSKTLEVSRLVFFFFFLLVYSTSTQTPAQALCDVQSQSRQD